MTVRLKGVKGLKLRESDGMEERGFPHTMSTAHFYEAEQGDKLVLLDERYELAVATYSAKVEERWLYTYDYAPDQAWLVYNGGLILACRKEHVFGKDTYFRVRLRRIDGGELDGKDINDIVSFEKRDVLRFALLTDTHYNVNGTWDATAGAIWTTCRRKKFDGVIHLGDLTDGMVSKELCKDYANIILEDLRATGLPVWVTLGNHDCNYFRNNPERMTPEEQRELYLGGNQPRYFVDFEPNKLRVFFLDSFDPNERLRYGYSAECIAWLESELEKTPTDWSILIFSHLPPVARLQYWFNEIRGDDRLIPLLHAYKNRILAWVNGHNHADHLDNGEGFPIISIANAKCEAFTERKPEGFVTPERELGGRTQECWDVLTVDPTEKTLRFQRQGSGNDRLVKDGKVLWLDTARNTHKLTPDCTKVLFNE